jgi:hypothetical protein
MVHENKGPTMPDDTVTDSRIAANSTQLTIQKDKCSFSKHDYREILRLLGNSEPSLFDPQ